MLKRAFALSAILALGTPVLWSGLVFSGTQADKAAAVRAASRQAVLDCAALNGEGTVREADGEWKALCTLKPTIAGWDGYRRERRFYTLIREGEGFRVRSEIVVDVQPAHLSKVRKDKILSDTQACMPVLKQYWGHYAINLDFSFRLKAKGEAPAPNAIVITDGPGRSHSRNYYTGGVDAEISLPGGLRLPGGPAQSCVKLCRQNTPWMGPEACADFCEPLRQREFCQMMLHETGHLLGLPDDYADPNCPDQKLPSEETYPWSAMAAPYFGLLDMPGVAGTSGIDTGLVEFYPRHIQRVLEPACPLSEI